MDILRLRTVNGPNVYHNKPVLIMKLDLKEWAEVASNEIPDFNKKLVSLFPGLQLHTCSPGYVGGFLERLSRGTYMAHITEHIALELSSLCGIGVTYGKSRYAGSPGEYNVIVRFLNEEGMKEDSEGRIKAL
ncbi:MAG: cyanophycin synthetase, partial [Bdellovibrionota bacterium]